MRARWLARWLLPILKRRIALAREPDFRVRKKSRTREGVFDTYLRRWWVIPRNDWFNVYLHNMVLDDDDVLHDHPYWSLSLVLTDGLLERYAPHPVAGVEEVLARRPRQGDLVWRSAQMAHQLIVLRPAWTLFITGPRVREWGFWCPRGWIPWHRYTSTMGDRGGSGTDSAAGVGCGEQ